MSEPGTRSATNTPASTPDLHNQEVAALESLMATTGQISADLAKTFEEILLYLSQISTETANMDTSGLLRYEQACEALNASLKEAQNSVSALRSSMGVLSDLSKGDTSLAPTAPKQAESFHSAGGFDSPTSDAGKEISSWEEYLSQLSHSWTDTTETLSDSHSLTGWLEQLNKGLSTIKEFNTAINTIYSFRSGIEKLSETFDTSIVKNFA